MTFSEEFRRRFYPVAGDISSHEVEPLEWINDKKQPCSLRLIEPLIFNGEGYEPWTTDLSEKFNPIPELGTDQ